MRSAGNRERWREQGFSLLEVLVAVTLLGLGFAAIFSGFSSGLRAADRLEQHQRALVLATNKLNEFLLDPGLAPNRERVGTEFGLRWQGKARLIEERPGANPERPVQTLRVSVEVSWDGPASEQSLTLETLKLRVAEPEAAR